MARVSGTSISGEVIAEFSGAQIGGVPSDVVGGEIRRLLGCLALGLSAASACGGKAADGSAGDVNGAASNEGIGGAIEAVPSDGHGTSAGRGGEVQCGSGGEGKGGEEGSGAGHEIRGV